MPKFGVTSVRIFTTNIRSERVDSIFEHSYEIDGWHIRRSARIDDLRPTSPIHDYFRPGFPPRQSS